MKTIATALAVALLGSGYAHAQEVAQPDQADVQTVEPSTPAPTEMPPAPPAQLPAPPQQQYQPAPEMAQPVQGYEAAPVQQYAQPAPAAQGQWVYTQPYCWV
jgi:hypothetical protein